MGGDRKRILARREALRAALLAVAVEGCGGGGGPEPQVCLSPLPPVISKASVEAFAVAVRTMQHLDEEGWTDADCNRLAQDFERIAETTPEREAEALYNAASCHQRCRHDDEARALHERVLRADPRFHRSRLQLALLQLDADGDLGRALQQVERAVKEGGYANAEAHVLLAQLYLRSGRLDDAHMSAKRALALGEHALPARNVLALYHLARAKEAAGRGGEAMRVTVRARTALSETQLAPATAICDESLAEAERYAPLHNTCGLVEVEARRFDRALDAFGKAVAIDRRFFDAWMNLGALASRLRRFNEATRAHEHALKLRPKDYEVHLGLALALRAGIDESNRAPRAAKARRLLERAITLEPSRPEAHFNLALLADLQLASAPASQQPTRRAEAISLFEKYLALAEDDPSQREAVAIAKERLVALKSAP